MLKRLDKTIFRKVRNANLKYNLICDGDKLAVGMSGGKDSMTLLYYIIKLHKYTPLSFDFLPVYIDLGWGNNIFALESFCHDLGVELIVEKTDINNIITTNNQDSAPCSLCTNLRKGALNRVAKKLGCNKVALGHHLNDVSTTWLMSIIYEGRFRVFKPKTYLDRIDIEIIRPLIYVQEAEIKSFIQASTWQTVENLCPVNGRTKRTYISDLFQEIEKKIPDINEKIVSALEKIDEQSFWR